MEKKKKQIKFVPYNDNKYYRKEDSCRFPEGCDDFDLHYLDFSDKDPKQWDIDKMYNIYCEEIHPKTKLNKKGYQDIIYKIVCF